MWRAWRAQCGCSTTDIRGNRARLADSRGARTRLRAQPGSHGSVAVTGRSRSRVRASADGGVGESVPGRRHWRQRKCAAFYRNSPATAVVLAPKADARQRDAVSGTTVASATPEAGARSPHEHFLEDARHGRRERQRAWRQVTPERPDMGSPQARRAAPVTRAVPQHGGRLEGKRTAPRRRRGPRDAAAYAAMMR